ncbi:MAG TPA: hypothetical protein VLM89_13405 [Phycisphaerae bacterium]|nr:hypothetical protein [Phycisphaerae bacterium]
MARFAIQYDQAAVDELRSLRRVDQVAVLDAIERHLLSRPTRVSRQTIKKLEPRCLLRIACVRVTTAYSMTFTKIARPCWSWPSGIRDE